MTDSPVPNGGVSWWWQHLGGTPAPRAALDGDLDVDVAIVGAGYTGLWAAYYLKRLQPDLRIVVLEQRFAGFGASGRNGGWLTNTVTGGRERYAASHGRDAAVAQQRALNDTVDEVIAVAEREGIDADIVKGGELDIARSPAQLARLRSAVAAEQAWPHTDVEEWDAATTAARVGVEGVLGGMWHPHCARVHPAKLVAGLAAAVERLGVRDLRADARDRDHRRSGGHRARRRPRGARAACDRGLHARSARPAPHVAPDELVDDRDRALPASAWDRIGWDGRETLGDFAHVYMYAQRTADDRIAFGGRGVPYRFGSRVDTDGSTQQRTIASLTALLRQFFPDAADVPIAHAWAGVLGVARDWAATVGHDRATGLGWAGGYVGTGVTATNLAGRALADLVLGRDTDLVRPAVGGPPREELGAGAAALDRRERDLHRVPAADRAEASARSSRTAWPARVADVIAGRH